MLYIYLLYYQYTKLHLKKTRTSLNCMNNCFILNKKKARLYRRAFIKQLKLKQTIQKKFPLR